MADPHRTYEIRCPIHGFIPYSDWEREIINQPAFQRLRRIRQLALTDYIYPGAMHTRFEHSLGVMHIASQLYDAVSRRSLALLKENLGYTEVALQRDKVIVRLTALLHDTGHGPFSHGGEAFGLFPLDPSTQKEYKHEQYSAAIIRHELRDVIENHPLNKLDIKANDIATLLEGSGTAGHRLFWRQLIDGQMDADRMDYLLRDSLHAGVDYGKYDWRRLLNTIQAIEMPQREGEDAKQGLRLGVTEGGIHAAEALVLARYFMFTQVYFHKTRVAYDHHLRRAMKELLGGASFPTPEPANLKTYMAWDDWKVLGMLSEGKGGEHGGRLSLRNHYRQIYHTPECPDIEDLTRLASAEERLQDHVAAREEAEKSWYKVDQTDIPVEMEDGPVRPLSALSAMVKNLKPTRRIALYSMPERAEEARAIVADLQKEIS